MRTKLISIGLAIVLMIATINLALADKPTPGALPPGKSEVHPTPNAALQAEKGGQRHGIFGTITSKSGDTFTVSTKQGDVVVTVSADTRYHIPTKRNPTIADLAVGDQVAVSGTPTASGLAARQIAVAPGKPTIQHRVGEVTAYAAGSSITIDVKDGSETFALTGQTIIRNPKGTGVAVGDRVTIVSRRDPSTDTFTATAIVVHPQ
jgi:Domain of unknown function (DUF5666)